MRDAVRYSIYSVVKHLAIHAAHLQASADETERWLGHCAEMGANALQDKMDYDFEPLRLEAAREYALRENDTAELEWLDALIARDANLLARCKEVRAEAAHEKMLDDTCGDEICCENKNPLPSAQPCPNADAPATRKEYDDFLGRAAELVRDKLPKAGMKDQEASNGLKNYLLKQTGKTGLKQLTAAQWERLLKVVEDAAAPEDAAAIVAARL